MLAVDIYDAAYGFAESSDDSTNMGNSVILSLRSNRRQDYQSAWHLLSEAVPAIIRDDLDAGIRAVVRGLHGYVRRERHYEPYPGEPSTESFSLGPFTANFQADWSHTWYLGGFQPVQDGPVLLKKFDEYLGRLASEDGAAVKIEQILTTLAQEPVVIGAVWGSLLVAGTNHPSVFARQLSPLSCAPPIMRSSDTRFQLGGFIAAAYEHLTQAERDAFERALLNLPDDVSGKRSKSTLAGCIPRALISTAEMRDYVNALEQAGELRPNVPPVRFTSGSRAFDTDAYLASEGVALEDPENAALRKMLREVENVAMPNGTAHLSLESVQRQIKLLKACHVGLSKRFAGKVPAKLFEHATGQLAEAASRIARGKPNVLATPSIKRSLKDILFFCAASKNPHYSAKHERGFQESVSWGGPSARTAAAHGLMDLTRASKRRDAAIMAAIRKLARDPVPEVRLQIVQNLWIVRFLDRDWAWSELEYALAKEVTRGVVGGAIDALSRMAHQDYPRTIRAAKSVIRRYGNKNKPGMAACRSEAETLIFDLHIWDLNAEADTFAAAVMGNVISNAGIIRNLTARYSDNLLKGSIEKPEDANNLPRQKTIAFYQTVTELAFREIEDRAARRDMRVFDSWPEADKTAVRDMFGILDEVSIRIHFAAGTHYDGVAPTDDVSPERVRLYRETKPILTRLSTAIVAPIAHHLIQTLETFIPIEPSAVFALIAEAVKSAEQGGYSNESAASDPIVRITQRYLADYRAIFADRARLNDLMDCLDVFVRAGWPAAQALTFKLGEIWR
ncbi:hypothetical protein [Bradyrhizobium sp. BR 1432]|uniref:hypothetical protein n=1 Tax=Bradyrhizobium sp. BR 1432 TaxID=3447966 RepID=UPI003EE67524